MDMVRKCAWVITFLVLRLKGTNCQNDPTNLACSAINSTGLQVTWTQATGVTVLGYHIDVLRVDGIKIVMGLATIDLPSKLYDTYDVNGLGKYGQYDVTIHSYTSSSNNTDYTVTCTTSEDVPDGSSLNFNCVADSISEITCTWIAISQSYWNGILLGHRVQWLGPNVSDIYEATVSDTTYTYTATSLTFDTKYIFLLNAYTSVGHGTAYSTDIETTLGGTSPVIENATKYYCYEAVPGMIEFEWDEMPCTVYVGTIGALFVICAILISIFTCQACCGQAAAAAPAVEINIENGGRSKGIETDNETDTETDNTGTDSEYDDDHDDNDGTSPHPESTRHTPLETPLEDTDNKDDMKERFAASRSKAEAGDIEEGGTETEYSDSDYSTQSEDEEADIGIRGGSTMKTFAAAKSLNVKAKRPKKIEQNPNTAKVNQTTAVKPIMSNKTSNAKESDKRQTRTHRNDSWDEDDEDGNSEFYEEWNPEAESNPETNIEIVSEGRQPSALVTNMSRNKTIKSKKHSNKGIKVLNHDDQNMSPRTNEGQTWNEDFDEWGDPQINSETNTGAAGTIVSRNTISKSKKHGKLSGVSEVDTWNEHFDEWGDPEINPETNTNIAIVSVGKQSNALVTNMSRNQIIKSNKHFNKGTGVNSDDQNTLPGISEGQTWNENFDEWGEPGVNPETNSGIVSAGTNVSRNTMIKPKKHFNKGKEVGNYHDYDELPRTSEVHTRHTYADKGEYPDVELKETLQMNYSVNAISSNHMEYTGTKTGESLNEWDNGGSGTRKIHVVNKSTVSNSIEGNVSNQNNVNVRDNISSVRDKHSNSSTAHNSVSHLNNSMSVSNEYKATANLNINRSNGFPLNRHISINEAPMNSKTEFNGNASAQFRHGSTGHVAFPAIKNEIEEMDAVFLSDNVNQNNLKHRIRTNSNQNPAWEISKGSETDTKRTIKTPIKKIKINRASSLIDAEPVIEIDRLGKRFPFLSIDNKTKLKSPDNTNGWMKRNKSDTNLKKQKNVIIPMTNLDPGHNMPTQSSTSDAPQAQQETKGQIFYGFGLGRFRMVAAGWVSKFIAKTRKTKTANSNWN